MTAPEKITSADQLGVTPAQVREWCAANGVEVAKTGRISSDVLAQYAAANPQ